MSVNRFYDENFTDFLSGASNQHQTHQTFKKSLRLLSHLSCLVRGNRTPERFVRFVWRDVKAQSNSGPPENVGLGSLPSAPEFSSLQVRTLSNSNIGSEPKCRALRMITFKLITYYDHTSLIVCVTRANIIIPLSLSSVCSYCSPSCKASD